MAHRDCIDQCVTAIILNSSISQSQMGSIVIKVTQQWCRIYTNFKIWHRYNYSSVLYVFFRMRQSSVEDLFPKRSQSACLLSFRTASCKGLSSLLKVKAFMRWSNHFTQAIHFPPGAILQIWWRKNMRLLLREWKLHLKMLHQNHTHHRRVDKCCHWGILRSHLPLDQSGLEAHSPQCHLRRATEQKISLAGLWASHSLPEWIGICNDLPIMWQKTAEGQSNVWSVIVKNTFQRYILVLLPLQYNREPRSR